MESHLPGRDECRNGPMLINNLAATFRTSGDASGPFASPPERVAARWQHRDARQKLLTRVGRANMPKAGLEEAEQEERRRDAGSCGLPALSGGQPDGKGRAGNPLPAAGWNGCDLIYPDGAQGTARPTRSFRTGTMPRFAEGGNFGWTPLAGGNNVAP